MRDEKADIVSIFSSIQGEGLYLGKPHLFIRFAGCNIRCRYCDTPEALVIPEYCRTENSPFSKTSYNMLNPVDSNCLFTRVKRLTETFPYYHSLVLTGGEPLLHTPFLNKFLPAVRRLKIPIMLETNGTLPKQLKEILNLVDIISMDIKIPSDVINPPPKLCQSTKEFLRISSRKSVYIKTIITESAKPKEYQKASRIITDINRHIPVILQPVSGRVNWQPDKLIKVHKIFTKTVKDVRIIPQVHRLMRWK